MAIRRTSAPRSRAKSAAVKSLSTTASTPRRLPSASRTSGMPPPPAATTQNPLSTKAWMASSPRMRLGAGEGTSWR